ncbi:hypothetical protein JN11_04072 [Mucilaginibacter frigoritolerans]|uniref:DUF4468 domain-containing protein n=1 Tax=Mucilaginibacter frigoritolerans TaxID=652788 RepID=A0A562TSX7_9SPHI|nr:hypothetical protein [Mucilaginibacter frigoritolerans]TWI96338.1 hypothetical protein JN11_04072 [Mucilaginibacter frigoritolerans]
MNKYPVLIFCFVLIAISAQAQKWQLGHFTDSKGNTSAGFIRIDESARGPVKNEGFIEYKQDKKAKEVKISASGLQSFVMGRDSFVVTHAPQGQFWPRYELDFVKIVLDDDLKLYATYSEHSAEHYAGGGGSGFSIGIGGGTGFGTRGFGVGVGGGVEIPLGGSGAGRGGYYGGPVYYYGENTAEMKIITNENFADVMTDVMGDEPDVVNKIVAKAYTLQNMDSLVAYFKQVQAARRNQNQ